MPSNDAGRYAYDLQRVFHEKARLGILTSLATNPNGLLFNDLKELCALTDGNLSRHIQVLRDEGLVEVWKRSRQTLCRMTAQGRKRFEAYVAELERVVRDALPATSKSPRGKKGPAGGFAPA